MVSSLISSNNITKCRNVTIVKLVYRDLPQRSHNLALPLKGAIQVWWNIPYYDIAHIIEIDLLNGLI